MNNPQILLNLEILENGAKIVKETNEIVAKLIGINPGARLTCTKPSGNASVLAMTASGIHPAHAKRYFRVVQLNKENPVAKYLNENFSDLLEEGVWSATNSDYACYIPIDEDEHTIVKSDIDEIKFLEIVKLVYKHWVLPGTVKDRGYSDTITHNVSNTVTVENWDKAFNYIYENKQYYCGLSFLPDTGDKIYKQSPFTEVLTLSQLIEKYKDAAIFASGLIVDALHCFNNDLWDACEATISKNFNLTGDRVTVLLKKDIIMRIKKFAKNYFNGNTKKTIECLKDVHLYHKYVKIQRILSLNEIDFSNVDYSMNYLSTDALSGVACSADGCEIKSI